MSDLYICRTETFNTSHPCFADDQGECSTVTIEECGLDLKGIPKNEQTIEYFNVAKMTGLSTILSLADATEFANRFLANASSVFQKIRGSK